MDIIVFEIILEKAVFYREQALLSYNLYTGNAGKITQSENTGCCSSAYSNQARLPRATLYHPACLRRLLCLRVCLKQGAVK